jgi:hypothetical protein
MSDFNQYNPARVLANFAGYPMLGFMDGTFIKAERNDDAFEAKAGVLGDVTRVRKNSKVGTVTFTLMQNSPTNDVLSGLATLDELFGTGTGALLITDTNGNTLISATNAWIKKLPSVEYSDTASGREWAIDCAELVMTVGGSVL